MKILIDADACPKTVLQVCLRLGKQYGLQVWTVASFNHQVTSNHHVVVGNAPQEADIKVMNLTQAGDIIVTQDWGLAAAVLGRGALAISPMGKEYRAETIAFMLEEREIKAKLRRGGGRTKGPSKRTLEDDQRFTAQLQRMLQGVEEMDDATK